MHFLQALPSFNWKDLLFGAEKLSFLPEIVLRTVIMFILILITLRLLGKRGVKQLSVFELVVIIGLGSAAGDPMYYRDAGILTAIVVFMIVVGLYRMVTYLIGKSKKFEKLVEGKPVCLIKEGAFSIKNFEKDQLSEDEFFAELRFQGVSQLGQIEEAIEESSGNISIFYYPDDEVKYGLPIMPDSFGGSLQKIPHAGYFSCIFCGYTEKLKPESKCTCPTCNKFIWVEASNRKRIR